MRIKELVLPVTDLAGSLVFFGNRLQLPVKHRAVRIGWSMIELIPVQSQAPGCAHLAFNVPYERFDAAMAWLRARTALLRSPDGLDQFHLAPPWDSRSVYFEGPDGAVLELIGRQRLPGLPSLAAFDGSEMNCLSEVGLPTDDVAGIVQQAAQTNLRPFATPSDQFAPIGTDEGLLIVVDAARPWFPQRRQQPGAHGLRLTIEAQALTTSSVLVEPLQGWELRALPA